MSHEAVQKIKVASFIQSRYDILRIGMIVLKR